MSESAAPTSIHDRRRQFRQMLVGLVALPLSAVPFLAYGMFTPEGRILRDRLIVSVSPPQLPELSAAEEQAAAGSAPRYANKVMALVYHGVGSISDAEGGFVVSPQRFGEHLATLRAAGLVTVTAADVARAFAGEAPLPDNAVMITFDDGRADALLFADPLLDQARMRATMFVISSATDRPNLYYAGWDRIEKAARSGRWDIEAHTHASHRQEAVDGGDELPVLTSLAPGESIEDYRARIAKDLDRNDEAIADHVGHKPVAFAYPFGAYGGDRTNDPRLRDILRDEIARRYRLAFHQDEQESVPLLDPGQDAFGLRRLEVGDWSGTDLLGRVRAAAEGASAPGIATGVPADDAGVSELLAPPLETRATRPMTPTTIGKAVRLKGPAVPAPVIGEPAVATRSQPGANAPAPEAPTTTGPPATTPTSGPPDSTTTSTTTPSTTTTTQPPTTTSTTRPPTTTTTRPSSGTSSTTTTEKPCRGKKGDMPCRR